ncbi:MAG: helix-turn-helix transcriptional regulator [Pseudomonadaceae bacterium]
MATTTTAQTAITPTLTRPKQTAEHFQISIMTLHRWRKQSDFPQPLKRGAVVLYNCPAIKAWLNGES